MKQTQGEIIKPQITFIQQLQTIQNNLDHILQKTKQVENNIIIIGESGAGKSTLCNILMDKNITFKYEQLQFKPVQDKSNTQFKISSDCTKSETEVPQGELLSNDYLICDVPGLQDSKSELNDIITCLNIQEIVNTSQKVQIVLVFSEKEITDNKFKDLIEILNQYQDNSFAFTFLITFVEDFQSKEDLCDDLDQLLCSSENKLNNRAKLFLKNTLDNRQQRIQILSKPVKKNDYYYFNEDEVNLIRVNILRRELFQKLNLLFSFTDVNKQAIKSQLKILQAEVNEIWNKLFKVSIKIQIKQNSYILPNNQQNQEQLYQLEEDYAKNYSQKLQQINYLRKLIPEQDQLQSLYEIHKNEIQSILENIEIDQQLQTIRIFCSFMSVSKLQNILQNKSQYNKVFIYCLVQFQVDQSFVSPGLQIYIKTKQFIVVGQKNVIIDLKGIDGQPIHPSKAGQDQNSKTGENGKAGNDGQNGGYLYVDSQSYDNLNLLTIDVSGGNGSNGQDGGDGLDGKNGIDADPRPVDQKDKKYIIQVIEKKIENKDLENQEVGQDELENVESFQDDQELVQLNEQFQQTIIQEEQGTLNKFNIVLLENKGSPGSCGGNSGSGGIGGCKGLKGQVWLNNVTIKLKELRDQDGQEGNNGHDGIVGKGGLQGKNYLRAYYDIQILEKLSKIQLFRFILATIITLGIQLLVFTTLSLVSFTQFCFREGQWLTQGNFIQSNIRANSGQINERKPEQREYIGKSQDDHKEFNSFISIVQGKRTSQIYQHMMNKLN